MKCKRLFKIGLVLILLAGLMFLTGCWGKQEVEELAPLLGVGFDLGEKPGTFLITQQFARPTKGSESGGEIKNRTFTVEASTARESIEKVSKLNYRTPFMGSLKVIVIGEDLAKASDFNDILDFAQRYSEFRRSMYLVIAKGKAKDILNLKLRSGLLPAMGIKSIIEGGDELSSFPTVRLGHYLTILGTVSTAPILPVLESLKTGEGGVEYHAEGNDEAGEMRINSAGVLHGNRLVAFLTDEETKGYMWLENQVANRFIDTVKLKEINPKFGGRVIKSRTKYKIKDNNGKMELQYQIKSSVEIDEVLGLKKQVSGSEWVDLITMAEKNFAEVIKKECETSIKKERELSYDFLGIGRHLEEKKFAYWKTIKDHWEEEIKDFPISVEVEVTVHHSGMSSSSAVNSTGEGQE